MQLQFCKWNIVFTCIQLYFTYIKYGYSSNKYDKLLNFKFLRLVVKYQYNNHFCSFNVTNMCNNKLLWIDIILFTQSLGNGTLIQSLKYIFQ